MVPYMEVTCASFHRESLMLPQFTSSISYMVPYMGMTFASFHISQVPIHSWCHVWRLFVRPSVFHKFHIIYGTWHHVWYHIKVQQPYMAPSIPCMAPYNPYMHAIYDFFYKGTAPYSLNLINIYLIYLT